MDGRHRVGNRASAHHLRQQATKNEPTRSTTAPVAQVPSTADPRLSPPPAAPVAEAAACSRGNHPATVATESVSVLGQRVVFSNRAATALRQVGARSGADGCGATLRRRRLSPRACGSPLLRTGGLPEGAQGTCWITGCKFSSSGRRGISKANRDATRHSCPAFPSRIHG